MLKIIQILLDAGASTNTEDKNGATPLHFAAASDVVGLFRAHINVMEHQGTRKGQSALHRAVWHEKLQAVKTLLELGFTIDLTDSHGETPLHLARNTRSGVIAKALIEAGADIEARGRQGCRPIHYAAGRGMRETVQLLVDHGVDIHSRDIHGREALIYSNFYICGIFYERGCHHDASPKDRFLELRF